VPDVVCSRDGAVLTITLSRPEVLNALTRAALGELAGALADAAGADVRAVVLTGAGRGFCVGQDLRELTGGADVGDLLRTAYHPVVEAIRTLEKPVVAAINGPAAGAGLSLALACDVRIAAEEASLVPAFSGVGLVPDAGATYHLARLLGPARAFEWVASGRPLAAREALDRGLVSEVVPGERLAAVAAERAAALAAGPTRALGLTKRLLDAAPGAPLAEQLRREAVAQVEAAATADFAEGARAFLEKRPPRFTGR
jgi:2-(1,2-epoxy-1,2-dihydrophenyl)acetyl-CoA isomerase